MQVTPDPDARLRVMVMGPSGVGKTTFARLLAQSLDADFIEGDDYHPPLNRAAMQAGQPLTDAMRAPWLEALAGAVAQSLNRRDTVFTCSALKRAYRDRLRHRLGALRLVYLTAPPDLIRRRMTGRRHFMPASLLGSQLSILEPPGPDEGAITLDMSGDLDALVRKTVGWLRKEPGG